MKNSLLCLVVLVLMAAVPAMAQEQDNLRWRGFETNRFWDNWEIAAAGGISSLSVANRDGVKAPGKFFDRVGWNANIAVTKWIVPTLGMRLQVDGGEFHNYSFDRDSYGGGIFKTPYLYVHGDILVNMSNWIGGYNPNRLYSAVSYMGFGYTAMSWTKASAGGYNGEYAFTAGLLNKFRVAPSWDIELDLRSWLFAEASLPRQIRGGGRYAVAMTATVGVAYRFGQRDWSPAYPQVEVDGYVAAIMTLEEGLVIAEQRLVAADKEIATLNSKNRALQGEVDRCHAEVVEAEEITSECAVFFTIGEASLTDYARATLESYVEQMREGNTLINVTGYADSETGSAARNEQLSKMRAEAVESYLVDAGIPASRITTTWVGDTVTAFTSPNTPLVNRCVIIK